MPPVKDKVEYREAHEVKRIAADLIYKYRPDLMTARIEYVFRSQTAEQRGKEIWGRARKISGLNAYLTGKDRGYEQKEPEPYFVIEISEPVWLVIEEKQKEALVFHELEHLDVDTDTSKYSLRGHDLEEFGSVVRRYGLWRDDVRFFIKAATEKEKLPLFDEARAEQIADEVMTQAADRINAGALGPNVTAIKSKRQ